MARVKRLLTLYGSPSKSKIKLSNSISQIPSSHIWYFVQEEFFEKLIMSVSVGATNIRCAPAMAADVVNRWCGMDDLYNTVTEHAAKKRAKAKRERWVQRLIDRLQRDE
jgi:hypothetical protein